MSLARRYPFGLEVGRVLSHVGLILVTRLDLAHDVCAQGRWRREDAGCPGWNITAMMAILPGDLVILSGVGTERMNVIWSVGSGVRSNDLTTRSSLISSLL
jgi:hypothetical protein